MTIKEWCVALLIIPLFVIGDCLKAHFRKDEVNGECW